MRIRSILCGLMFLILMPQSIYGQYLSYTPETDSLVTVGINQAHNLSLDSAIATFEHLIDYYPNHPIGHFYKAGIYDLFNQNYRIIVYEKKFEEAMELAIKVGEKHIKKNKNDALAYFYLGGAYGFRGLHRVYKRDWLNVFIDGYKGLKNLNKSLEKNPEFYDAYLGLGLYHYWRSAMTKKLRFLPFVSDLRQEGIDELKIAIEKGKYAGVETRIALASVYYNEEEYDSALVINNWLYKRFPRDPSILYTRTRIYEKKQLWQNMLETSNKLYNVITSYEYQSTGYKIECLYLKALAEFSLGYEADALDMLEQAIELEKVRNKKQELEGPNEDFDEIFDNVKKLYKKIIAN